MAVQSSERAPNLQTKISSMLQQLSERSVQDNKDLLVSTGKAAAEVEDARVEEQNIREVYFQSSSQFHLEVEV